MCKKILFYFSTLLLIASCGGNQGDVDFKNYNDRFSCTNEISVNIQNEGVYFIFYSDPSVLSVLPSPAAIINGPADVKLKLPIDVDTVFVAANGESFAFENTSSISIESTCNNLAEEKSYNTFFPNTKYNYSYEQLYLCTDLNVIQDVEEDVVLQYIGDGCVYAYNSFENENVVHCKVWLYTYPTSKVDDLTFQDCTFYGVTILGDSILHPIDFDQIQEATVDEFGMPRGNIKESHVFYNREGGVLAAGKLNRAIMPSDLLKSGMSIGFAMRGDGGRVQYSTPALNLSKGAFSYLGRVLKVDENGERFKIEQKVTNGYTHRVDLTDTFVVGMESQTINILSYDGDFNDMQLSINIPSTHVSQSAIVSCPDIPNYYTDAGIYLYEEDYPTGADFDLNDMVVEYKYKVDLNSNKVDANFKLQAYSCDLRTTFGINNIPIFSDVIGTENVGRYYGAIIEKDTTLMLESELTPYFNNSYKLLTKDVFHTNEFPYILIIPSFSVESSGFKWCKESYRLDDAYNFSEPRTKDWYIKPKNLNKVVDR